MSIVINAKGTSLSTFGIGKNKLTLDASNLTTSRTWIFPDSNGSSNQVLTTDGTGVLSWTSAGVYIAGTGLTLSGNTFNVGTASSSRIVVNADDIDLATVSDSGTGTFLKLARDSYGRVSGTTAVTTSDITSLVDSTYVNVTGDTMSGNLTVPSLNTGQLAGFRNKLINGGFNVWQRGTSTTVTPTAGVTQYVTADRWFLGQTGSTAQQVFDRRTSDTATSQYGLRFGRINGQTNVPSIMAVGQTVESVNCYPLRGKTITLSFKSVRGANAPTTLNAVVRVGTGTDQGSNGGLGGSWTGYSQLSATAGSTAVTVGTSIASYSVSFSMPSNATEAMVMFYYTPTGTAGANEWFAIEEVQLEIGDAATPFESLLYSTELSLCQRYYYRDSIPFIFAASQVTNSYGSGVITFPVNMRVSPSALEQTGTANSYSIFIAGASTICTSVPAFSSASNNNGIIFWYATSGHTGGQAGYFTGGYLGFSAEL